jgi:hypothetical protein
MSTIPRQTEQVRPLLLTLDTNQLDPEQIQRLHAAVSIPHEFAYVTVSGRERGNRAVAVLEPILESGLSDESRWDESVWGGPIPEVAVLGEWRLGEAVLASSRDGEVLESALRIIGNGSFPRPRSRGSLTPGQRRQLRDAMIFEAHVRHQRHVLVTSDARGFIRGGRRRQLELLGSTRVLAPDELEGLAAFSRLSDLFAP